MTNLHKQAEPASSEPCAVMIGRLSMERCQNSLAHLIALSHLYDEEDSDEQRRLIRECKMRIIADIGRELDHHMALLDFFE